MKWEYVAFKELAFAAETPSYKLTVLGDLGWELVSVVLFEGWFCFYMKRPIVEKMKRRKRT